MNDNLNEQDADRLRRLEQENERLRQRLAGEAARARSAAEQARSSAGCAGSAVGAVLGGLCALLGGLAYFLRLEESIGKYIFLVAFCPMIAGAGAIVGAVIGSVVGSRRNRAEPGAPSAACEGLEAWRTLSEEQRATIRSLARSGRQLEAIKEAQRILGVSLNDAGLIADELGK
jgi:hypothetical protein